jgi:hypothetical protein
MPTSNSYNYTNNRDQIITRALRIVGAIGQGETPQTAAITEASQALNDLVKAWEADGMQLWCVREYQLTPMAGLYYYNVGVGQAINEPAPTKIIQAWSHNSNTNTDTPILIITRQEYNMLGSKFQGGTTSQMFYQPPGNISGTESVGLITLYLVPDANYASNNRILFNGVRPLQDFDSATDVMDFPQYWGNAVTWGLAAQLCYEYGVGLSERGMIERRAEKEKDDALSYGTEEGHILIQPAPLWRPETWQ